MIGLAKFNELADRHGFVVAYPDGLNRRWNDGRQSGRMDRPAVDDTGFLSALIDKLGRDYRIDPKRVYSTGISNGGFMSQRLACDLADKIAAVGVVAATMGRDLAARCKPARPVSVLLIQGTEDPLVPYEGGRVQVPGGGAIISAPDAVKKWVDLNGCNAQPKKDMLPDSATDETRTRREIYGECRVGTGVVFLAIEGGGHTWPSGPQYLPERRIGRASRDFSASEMIWEFFSAHARR
jgi:polyhydroxybutyrate depolymerase